MLIGGRSGPMKTALGNLRIGIGGEKNEGKMRGQLKSRKSTPEGGKRVPMSIRSYSPRK